MLPSGSWISFKPTTNSSPAAGFDTSTVHESVPSVPVRGSSIENMWSSTGVCDGESIAVVHTQGEWFAVSDICSHADVSLAEGEVDGCTLECWLHGSRFDLRTGVPSGPPAVAPIPVYPVSVEGDTVFVTVA